MAHGDRFTRPRPERFSIPGGQRHPHAVARHRPGLGRTVGGVPDIEGAAPAFTVPAGIWCSKCSATLPLPPDMVRRCLNREQAICPRCGYSRVWWMALLETVNSVMSVSLFVIGANHLIFDVILRPGHETILDFTASGVPEDAQILRVNYTVNAEGQTQWLVPTQPVQSQPGPPWIQRKVILYPYPAGSGAAAEATKLSVLVAWLPPDEPDAARTLLVEALTHSQSLAPRAWHASSFLRTPPSR